MNKTRQTLTSLLLATSLATTPLVAISEEKEKLPEEKKYSNTHNKYKINLNTY